MTLAELQDELARVYLSAGEKGRVAEEHAKAGRYPQAYRLERKALEDEQAAQALWPMILKSVVSKEKAS